MMTTKLLLSFAVVVLLCTGSLHAQSSLSINQQLFTIYSPISGVYPVALVAANGPSDVSQAWFLNTTDGYITSVLYPEAVLDVAYGGPSTTSAQVTGYPRAGTANQLWNINQTAGTFESQAKAGLFLTSNNINGTIYAWATTDTPPQSISIQDFIIPTPTSTPSPATISPTVSPTPTSNPPTVSPTPSAVPPTVSPTPSAVPPTVSPIPATVAPTVSPIPATVAPTVAPTPVPCKCCGEGDVHYYPFKKTTHFDNQGVGFFQLAKTTSGYTFNTLTKPCGVGYGASCNKALILTFPSNTLQISEGDVLLVNGVRKVLAKGASVTMANVVATKNAYANYQVSFPGGHLTWVQYTGRITAYSNNCIYLDDCSSIPVGLCNRPGTKRSDVSVEDEIAWGELYRVNNSDATGYTFDDGETFDELNDVGFVQDYDPVNSTDAALNQQAVSICSRMNGDLANKCARYSAASDYYSNCISDILATGDIAFGAGTIDAFTADCSFYAASNNVSIALPTSAIQSTASGSGLGPQIVTSSAYSFTIQAKDINGVNVAATVNDFTITSNGAASISFTQTANSDGTVTAYYKSPSVVGSYNISVQYLGTDDISGSPFSVSVVQLAVSSGYKLMSSNLQFIGVFFSIILTLVGKEMASLR